MHSEFLLQLCVLCLVYLCSGFGFSASGGLGGRLCRGAQRLQQSSVSSSPTTDSRERPVLYASNAAGPSGITLPTLSRADRLALQAGERVQRQERTGRAGYGIVVLDVQAPPDVVFESLTRFEKYKEMIPTVRSVKIFSSNDRNTLAEFSLSKFCLKVNVMHTVLKEQRVIKFSLDDSRPNLVMRQAEGFWHVQAPPDRPEGYSRVYLSSNIVASRLVPVLIVDYAAARALPRATTWLQEYKF